MIISIRRWVFHFLIVWNIVTVFPSEEFEACFTNLESCSTGNMETSVARVLSGRKEIGKCPYPRKPIVICLM